MVRTISQSTKSKMSMVDTFGGIQTGIKCARVSVIIGRVKLEMFIIFS
jgi:hypothetical protein